MNTTIRTAAAAVVVSLAFLSTVSAQNVAQRLQSPAVVDQLLSTIVAVQPIGLGGQLQGHGSGTIISPQGYILTNFHVVSDTTATPIERSRILISSGFFSDPQFEYVARFVVGEPELDLAILQIVEDSSGTPIPSGQSFPFVKIADHRGLRPDDEISVWGYPGLSGRSISATRGTIGGFAGEDRSSGGERWIRTDAQIFPGNSGGAAITLGGYLVGVPTILIRSRVTDAPEAGDRGFFLYQQGFMRPAILFQELMDVPGTEIVSDPQPVQSTVGDSLRPHQTAELTRRARAGGIVRLSAGTFVLNPLELTDDVEIVGAGQNATVISFVGSLPSDALGALQWTGTGTIRLRDLTIEYVGSSGGDARVIFLTSGQADFRNITVQGGRGDEGTGIQFEGSAAGLVSDTLIRQNEGFGIVLAGSATVQLLNSTITNNGRTGISFVGAATGMISGNTVSANVLNGLALAGSGTPTVRGNEFKGNGWNGATFSGAYDGVVSYNTFEGNERHGVVVADRATPSLHMNVMNGNGVGSSGFAGIAYADGSGGTAQSNTIDGNGNFGILCWPTSTAVLSNNSIRNHEFGIAVVVDVESCEVDGTRYSGNELNLYRTAPW